MFFSGWYCSKSKLEFKITDTKLYVLVVTFSTQNNVKLLKQLESGFKRTINWNKYQFKTTNQVQNRYLDFLIDASFPGVNRLYVLSFKDENGWESYKQYYLSTVEIKTYNVMIDGRNVFDEPIKNANVSLNAKINEVKNEIPSNY